jgi:hypothetical protein
MNEHGEGGEREEEKTTQRPIKQNEKVDKHRPEAVFLVSLRTSLFPAGNEVYGKSIERSFLAGNELNPSSFVA